MGKVRPGKRKDNDRFDPTGTLTTEEANEILQETSREEKLIMELSHMEASQRCLACHSIGTLAGSGDKGIMNNFVEGGAIRILSTLLYDSNIDVAGAAAGCLRNFATAGGEDVCKRMTLDDVLSPAIALFKKTTVTLDNEDLASNKELNSVSLSIVEQLTQVISHLCETSDLGVDLATRSDLAPYLASLLNQNRPLANSIAAAQCLAVLTENNPAFQEQMFRPLQGPDSPTAASCLQLATTFGSPQLSILCIAAAVNITPLSSLPATVSSALPTILDLVAMDGVARLQDMSEEDLLASEDGESAARAAWRSDLAAQCEALQVLVNMTAIDEEGGWEIAENVDDDAAALSASSVAASSSGLLHPLVQDLVGVLNPVDLVQRILPRCQPAPSGMHQMALTSPQLAELLVPIAAVQARALNLLGNLILCMPASEPSQLVGLWPDLCRLADATARAAVDSAECLEAVSTAMVALYRKVSSLAAGALVPAREHALAIVHMAESSPHVGVRQNALTLLACVGQLSNHADLLPDIMRVVLNSLSDSSPWVVAEALNTIFDVFAEPHVNSLVVEAGMMEALTRTLPLLKGLIKKARGEGDLMGTLDEARINLTRFIKYKQAQF